MVCKPSPNKEILLKKSKETNWLYSYIYQTRKINVYACIISHHTCFQLHNTDFAHMIQQNYNNYFPAKLEHFIISRKRQTNRKSLDNFIFIIVAEERI